MQNQPSSRNRPPPSSFTASQSPQPPPPSDSSSERKFSKYVRNILRALQEHKDGRQISKSAWQKYRLGRDEYTESIGAVEQKGELWKFVEDKCRFVSPPLSFHISLLLSLNCTSPMRYVRIHGKGSIDIRIMIADSRLGVGVVDTITIPQPQLWSYECPVTYTRYFLLE